MALKQLYGKIWRIASEMEKKAQLLNIGQYGASTVPENVLCSCSLVSFMKLGMYSITIVYIYLNKMLSYIKFTS